MTHMTCTTHYWVPYTSSTTSASFRYLIVLQIKASMQQIWWLALRH